MLKPCILVVDDRIEYRQRVSEALKSEGFDTVNAVHGGKALSALSEGGREFVAVVTDQEMITTDNTRDLGALDGDEWIKEALKKNITLPPIIVYSAVPGKTFFGLKDLLGVDDIDLYVEITFSDDPDEIDDLFILKDPAINECFSSPDGKINIGFVPKTAVNELFQMSSITVLLERLGVATPEVKPGPLHSR